MKKKILTSVVVVFLVVGIIFIQAALGAYYITSSGQKIGYNQNTNIYNNYYSVKKAKIQQYSTTTVYAYKSPSKTSYTYTNYQKTAAPSPGYVIAGNQRIYYRNPSGTNRNYYQVKISNIPSNSSSSNKQPPVERSLPPDANTHKLTASELKLIKLINEERVKAGLNPLIIDYELCRVARLKSEDMRTNRYFSHTSPTYGSPFKMLKDFGITYKSAAENLGKTYSVERAHKGFMNSEGHRNNILNPYYTHIGVGISGNYYTELFIKK